MSPYAVLRGALSQHCSAWNSHIPEIADSPRIYGSLEGGLGEHQRSCLFKESAGALHRRCDGHRRREDKQDAAKPIGPSFVHGRLFAPLVHAGAPSRPRSH